MDFKAIVNKTFFDYIHFSLFYVISYFVISQFFKFKKLMLVVGFSGFLSIF